MLPSLHHEVDVDSPGPHRPVLLREVLDLLQPPEGGVIVDATVGPGGHARELLRRVGPSGRVLGVDRDPETLEVARRLLSDAGDRFVPLQGDYRDLPDLVRAAGWPLVDAVLADLGISSLQLDDPSRGFSFASEGPLDMRMDRGSGPTAADLLNTLSESDLRRILREKGEERLASAIARAIVRRRDERPLRTTTELATLVSRVAGPAARRLRIHPATRTFQALRIAVNREIEGLSEFVERAAGLLKPGGRIAVIAFHSLEDRAVKHALRSLADRCVCPPGMPVCGCGRQNLVRLLTARAIRPSPGEIASNPRSRSARLRAAERL